MCTLWRLKSSHVSSPQVGIPIGRAGLLQDMQGKAMVFIFKPRKFLCNQTPIRDLSLRCDSVFPELVVFIVSSNTFHTKFGILGSEFRVQITGEERGRPGEWEFPAINEKDLLRKPYCKIVLLNTPYLSICSYSNLLFSSSINC